MMHNTSPMEVTIGESIKESLDEIFARIQSGEDMGYGVIAFYHDADDNTIACFSGLENWKEAECFPYEDMSPLEAACEGSPLTLIGVFDLYALKMLAQTMQEPLDA